jgi:nucleoside-diphosphate-sugar epimerase
VSDKVLAITGGTGFVGRTLISTALAEGYQVRALARTPQDPQEGVTWLYGALDRPESLATLLDHADAVIHVAGVVNAPDRTAFEAGNVAGTMAIVEAARAAGVQRLIQVSSLAARLPALSNYGWSKAKAETIVAASAIDWTIVRPPWVYGPGDKDTLDVFKMAQRGLAFSPRGDVSVIHVADLATLLLALIPSAEALAQVYEPDDGRDDWTNASFIRAIGWAFGKRVHVVPLPKAALICAAHADRLVRGKRARLTLDRAQYMANPDWRVDPARRPPVQLWQPQVHTRTGLKATLADYCARNWL